MLHGDQLSGPAALNFQKASVTVGHVVSTANGIVICWTNLLAAPKREASQAPLHRYNIDVLPVKKSSLDWEKNSCTPTRSYLVSFRIHFCRFGCLIRKRIRAAHRISRCKARSWDNDAEELEPLIDRKLRFANRRRTYQKVMSVLQESISGWVEHL